MTTLRPALIGELDEQTPATLRDLHPALASLLRGVERTQRSLLVGYGSRVAGSSVNWPGPGEAGVATYAYPCRVPPGVSRIAFRLLGINGNQAASGSVKLVLDDGSGDHYTRVQLDYAPLDFASRVERSKWSASLLRPVSSSLSANEGACIELAPVLEWRTVDFLVEVPEAAYVFAVEPLIGVDDLALAPRRWGWGGGYAIQGGTSPGLQLETARNWAWREWRSVIVWVWLWEAPSNEALLAYGDSGSDARTTLLLTGATAAAGTWDTSDTLQRAVVTDDELGLGAWHQVILSWRQDDDTDAVVYVDGAAVTPTTNSVAVSPVDLSGDLDVTSLALHQSPSTLVAEIAELWGRVTAEEATAAWGDGVPHDLRRTVLGRRVMDYLVAAAHDEDPVTGRARLHNLGREPSWQRAVLGAGAAVVQMGPAWMTGYLDCNGTVWALAAGAMTGIAAPWTRVVVARLVSGSYGVAGFETSGGINRTATLNGLVELLSEGSVTFGDGGATPDATDVAIGLTVDETVTLTTAWAAGDDTAADGPYAGDSPAARYDIWLGRDTTEGLAATGTRIYADLVISGEPTVAELRAFLKRPPWQVYHDDLSRLLRCYIPALAYAAGSDVIIPDVARSVGGPLPAVHAIMQDGGLADIEDA